MNDCKLINKQSTKTGAKSLSVKYLKALYNGLFANFESAITLVASPHSVPCFAHPFFPLRTKKQNDHESNFDL